MNTTLTAYTTSNGVNSLTGAHELLFQNLHPSALTDTEDDGTHLWYANSPYDPFDDSSQAVTCYECGEYDAILQHNLADIHRTWELGELIREYVSSKDITTKKL